MNRQLDTLVDLLQMRAELDPAGTAFTFLVDGERDGPVPEAQRDEPRRGRDLLAEQRRRRDDRQECAANRCDPEDRVTRVGDGADRLRPHHLDHGGSGRGIGAHGVGRDRVGDGARLPYRQVGPLAACGGGEPAMLDGHMGEQVGKVPAGARRRPRQIVGCDGRDHIHRSKYSSPVHRPEIHIDMHSLMMCVCT